MNRTVPERNDAILPVRIPAMTAAMSVTLARLIVNLHNVRFPNENA